MLGKDVYNTLNEPILYTHDPPTEHDETCLNALCIGNKQNTMDSLRLSRYLACKYKNTHLNRIFSITLYFRHNTICQYLNVKNEYAYKLDQYIRFFEVEKEWKENVFLNYGLYLLNRQCYKESYTYTIYMNQVKVDHLNIRPDTMSGFKPGDKGKTLLVYMSGGLGDNIMYARFMKKLGETFSDQRILFLIYDELYWIYESIHKDSNSIETWRYSNKHLLPPFDYHINISRLYVLLQLDYKDIYIEYFPPLPYYPMDELPKDKKHIIVHWKGNPQNEHEEHNRQIKLDLLVPLFKRTDVQCITIAKDITSHERELLREHKVVILEVDKKECFRHSMSIILSVDAVITTDTSLAHMCGTLDVPCYTLLTAGCDWRWGKEKTTRWYPKMTLLRQHAPFDWSRVVEELVVIPIHR
jgi:hypothetical protein